uniref:Immunoglobulin V-set domain-containing protein n=1 Tax=Moschus moschiferus TaxID=68415 RepID=A0A8C6E521_MOSMO
MAWTVLLLGLLAYGSGQDAQTVVQQPTLSVSPGGTVTLTCGLSSGSQTQASLPDCFSIAQTVTRLESLIASLAPSLGTKPPSPAQGSSPRTKPTITVVWELIVTIPH